MCLSFSSGASPRVASRNDDLVSILWSMKDETEASYERLSVHIFSVMIPHKNRFSMSRDFS